MAELAFNVSLVMRHNLCPVGLLRDVDAGGIVCTRGFQNLFRSGALCIVSSGAGHFRSNLRRDSRASLGRDFAVLWHCLGADGA